MKKPLSGNGFQGILLRNTGVSVMEKGFEFLARFLLLPLMVSRLGVEAYGAYSVALAFSFSGLLALMDLGVRGASIKYASEYAAQGNRTGLRAVFQATFMFYSAVGLTCILILSVVRLRLMPGLAGLDGDLREPLGVLIACLGIQAGFLFLARAFEIVLEGCQRLDLSKEVRIGHTLLWCGSLGWVLVRGGGLDSVGRVLVGVAAVYLLGVAALTLRFAPDIISRNGSLVGREARRIWRLSGWLFLSSLTSRVIFFSPRLIGAVFLPFSQLALLDILIKPMQSIVSLVQSLNDAVIPGASHLDARKTGKAGLKRLYLKGTQLVMAAVFMVSIPWLAFMPDFLGLWLGEVYRSLAGPARLAWGLALPLVLLSTGTGILVGINRAGPNILRLAGMAVFQVVISFWIVPLAGLWGLAFVFILSFWLCLLPNMAYTARILGVRFFRDLLPAWAPTIGLGLGLGLFGWFVRFSFPAGAVSSWAGLIGEAALLMVLWGGAWLAWAAEPSDRRTIFNFLPKVMAKRPK